MGQTMAGGVAGSARDDARTGGLTLVGTPIGNLGDLSPRGREALASADVICAEDTRVTMRLLSACGIRGRLERCDENVIAARAPQLVARMQAGERVAFVSDAGMPAVADPGARLVDACHEAGVPVDVVPGPSAVTCAIAQAGFACEAFYFGGFLPRKDGPRARLLAKLLRLPAVVVLYESPHRVAGSLRAIADAVPERRVAMARELTKVHQELVRGTAREVARVVGARDEVRGEVVIVVDAPGDDELAAADGDAFDLDAAIAAGLAQGTPKSALARELAARSGRPRGEVYDLIQRAADAARG